jgi:D-glycero-D-manno-heptose 1,7-bisphosphate phosphatase
VRLVPGAAEAIARLNRRGVPVVVVTNQAGVAHGFFPETRIADVHRRLDELLARSGAHIDRYYYCPHHPEAEIAEYRAACRCRKPAPGMLWQAANDLGLDLAKSCLVGDKRSDIEAGVQAGCRVFLVRTGYGDGVARELAPAAELDTQGLPPSAGATIGKAPAPLAIVADLAEAVDACILVLSHFDSGESAPWQRES